MEFTVSLINQNEQIKIESVVKSSNVFLLYKIG
jgi:hypothetical protein